MKFEVKKEINDNDITLVLKGYYDFYERMYGKRRIPLLKRDVDYSLNPKGYIDVNDGNLIEAINTVKLVNEEQDFYVLNVMDENNELVAMARFKINPKLVLGDDYSSIHARPFSEIHIGEVLFLNNMVYAEGLNLYMEMINYLVEYMKAFGEPFDVVVEILKNDIDFIDVLEEEGFTYDAEKDPNERLYRTITLDKHISLEMEETVERNSSR